MHDFINVLFTHGFIQNAFFAGILASIACGITGTFVVIKRISSISGGIAHTALGGVGIAYYFGADPILGATCAALFAAVLLGIITIKDYEHADTIIGALWAVGMAVGVLFMSITPGYNANLITYLFGNILMVSKSDLWLLLILDVNIVFIVLFFFRQFVSISFDENYSRLKGLKVNTIYILLLCLIALTIVILIHVVGLILVIALLTLPAAIAGIFTSDVGRMMILSVILGLIFTVSGLTLSYYPDFPAGATIIIIAGTAYLFSINLKKIFH